MLLENIRDVVVIAAVASILFQSDGGQGSAREPAADHGQAVSCLSSVYIYRSCLVSSNRLGMHSAAAFRRAEVNKPCCCIHSSCRGGRTHTAVIRFSRDHPVSENALDSEAYRSIACCCSQGILEAAWTYTRLSAWT